MASVQANVATSTQPPFIATVRSTGALDTLDLASVREKFRANGVVLFRDFNATAQEFCDFSASLCSEFVVHPNQSRETYGDATLMGVTPGQGHFFAHAELAYSPFRPDVAWFFCERSAAVGGETTVCDGVQVLDRISTRNRALLEQKRVCYESSYAKKSWREFAPSMQALHERLRHLDPGVFSYELDQDETLHYRYVTPAISKTRYGDNFACCNSLLDSYQPKFDDGSDVPKPLLYDFISTTEELTIPVAWRAGDILMIDNSRVMHGRRAFADSNRKILARFANVDF